MCCFHFHYATDYELERKYSRNVQFNKVVIVSLRNPEQSCAALAWNIWPTSCYPQQFKIRGSKAFSSLSRDVLENSMNYSSSNWSECIKSVELSEFRWI